jgi:hypothetical protein
MTNTEFIPKSATILGVYESTLAAFLTEDPFNNGNTLEGVICNQSGHTYGALIIWKVNGEAVEPRRIYCTPKLYYPFTDDSSFQRKYKFPRYKAVRVYEKLDGTNICQYFYKDAAGKYYTTYKTRLTPVVLNTRIKQFEDMWKTMLTKYPAIENIREELYDKFSFSYELYGNKNLHAVRYNTDLDVRPIFSISQADALINTPDDKFGFNKDAEPVASFGEKVDIVNLYEKMRYEARAKSRKEGDCIVGHEGYVFYVLTSDDKWVMYKCKSELVESRDWIGHSIPKSIIIPTVWNALETEEELSRAKITTLLSEEFDEELVNKSVSDIDFCIKYVKDKIVFREKVLKFYREHNLDLNKDKARTMKCFSQHFSKNELKNVYTTLVELNLIER